MKQNNNTLYNYYNKHKKFLVELPKITQKKEDLKTLYGPKEFASTLLHTISQAYKHIYLTALYLENDQAGNKIIDAIFQVKKIRPYIKVKILVDWHRAQRGRIGENNSNINRNCNWYNNLIKKYPNIEIAIYGIPININEALGVFHLKGFIIDDYVLYSGANLNNEYLYVSDKYRYDRYHMIYNPQLSNTMLNYINNILLTSKVVKNFVYENLPNKKKKINKNSIRLFRKHLKKNCYHYQNNADFNELSITPLIGVGTKNILNKTIYHLICSAERKITLCTPYFNMPSILIRNLIYLLQKNKIVEIIVGDKSSNDFYTPPNINQPFKFISILPYLYEVNLRYFLKKLQKFIDNKVLIIRLWKEDKNSYHIKGLWIDNEWQLLTGNNLNLRALRLDLENALLIHDPKQEIIIQNNKELKIIRKNTIHILHYTNLQKISDYPIKINKLIHRIRKIRFDLLINKIL